MMIFRKFQLQRPAIIKLGLFAITSKSSFVLWRTHLVDTHDP